MNPIAHGMRERHFERNGNGWLEAARQFILAAEFENTMFPKKNKEDLEVFLKERNYILNAEQKPILVYSMVKMANLKL